VQFPHWLYRGSGLLAGDLAIEVHHRAILLDPSISGIALLHCQLADLGDLSSRLLCSVLEFSRRRNAVDDFDKAANPPCGLFDRISLGSPIKTRASTTSRPFEQISMLHDLPDFHANGSGDLSKIRLLVGGHRNVAF
jgi:hypothetical protein